MATHAWHGPAPAGIINLYKPPGPSSATYVYRLRRVFDLRKVGHAGSLDPFADGVLLACIGRGTKLVERLMGLAKHYRTTLHLGVTSRSFDTEWPFEPVPGAVAPSAAELAAAVGRFIGEIEQVPPVFSAVKIDGVASYQLARRREEVVDRPKKVRIDGIEIVAYEWPLATLDISCGRGTYIRAIARDLGQALGCGACCQTLTRTAVGPFRIEDSIRMDLTTADRVRQALIPPEEVLDLLRAERRRGAGGSQTEATL